MFINDAQYPKSTIWINNKKYIVPRVIFDVNYLNANASQIRIYTEDGMIDLNYKILGLKTDIRNCLKIVKTNFHQYIALITEQSKLIIKFIKLSMLYVAFNLIKQFDKIIVCITYF